MASSSRSAVPRPSREGWEPMTDRLRWPGTFLVAALLGATASALAALCVAHFAGSGATRRHLRAAVERPETAGEGRANRARGLLLAWASTDRVGLVQRP